MGLYMSFCEILDQLEKTPESEAQTRYWIIDQVLSKVLGYSNVQIVPEDTASSGGRPDYTILPGTDFTWFVEAKSWSVDLTDDHATQAVTYASNNGRQWVVLTNGRSWRLYDSYVTNKPVDGKLVLEASREDEPAATALLAALHRESLTEGRLIATLRSHLASRHLAAALADPVSDCIKALRNVLRKLPRLEHITADEIVRVLAHVVASPDTERRPPQAADTSGGAGISPSNGDNAARDVPGPRLNADGDAVSVSDRHLWGHVKGREVIALWLPDDTQAAVTTWRDVMAAAVEWLAQHAPAPIPVPWVLDHRTGLFWINTTPMAGETYRMGCPHEVSARGSVFFLQTHNHAGIACGLIRELSKAVGVDPRGFRAVVR